MCKKDKQNSNVSVTVNVTKMVLSCCVAAVCVVGIIFGTSVAKKGIEMETQLQKRI